MIRRIRVCNFKSLRDVTVDLEPVTVFIGRSGAGKTNFIHALRFLREYLKHREQAVNNFGGWPYVLCATHAENAKLSFDVTFEVPGIHGECRYILAFQMTPRRFGAAFFAESLTIDGQLLFSQQNKSWTHPPEVVDAPKAGASVFGSLYGIPEARIAHIVLTAGLGCYDFPGNVLQEGTFKPGSGTDLKDGGQNFITALDAINTNLADLGREKDMRVALQRLNSAITSVDLASDRSHVRVGHKVGDRKILALQLRQESEGFRRFLAHLIALNQQPPKQILAFEEPEKGIYPGALAVLADYFQAVADSGRSQVILTTHSPDFLKHFKTEQIRAVAMEGYETKIGPVAKEQRTALEQHLMTADELLTVDEARIDSSDSSA